MPKGRHAKLSHPGRWRLKQSPRFTRRRFLIGSVALVLLASVTQAAHWLPAVSINPSRRKPGESRRLLNGVWEFQPASYPLGNRPPSNHWVPIRVPSEWNMTVPPNFDTVWGAYDIWETPKAWDQAEGAWYQVRFSLEHAPRGRLRLHFDAVNFSTAVYVNEHPAGENWDGTLPFTLDITEWVHAGDNTIWVSVAGPQTARGGAGFLYPMGSWWGQRCAGIWQDVWLIDQDELELHDLRVETSVRRKEFLLESQISNHGETAHVHVTQQVWDGPRVVWRKDHTVQVASRQIVPLHWHVPWDHPRLWTPEDPHLYEATIDLSVGGTIRESAAVRFGFREVWVEGRHLVLNGEPLRLRGDEWHYFGSLEQSRAYAETWYRMARTAHANYVRLHAMPYPPVFYDVADEVGMLIVAESAIYGSSHNLALTEPAFWEHAQAHLAARVKRDRHHPSIILWSAENEILAAYGDGWASQVAALKLPVLAHDPTRPIYFEGDGDPAGMADLISWHYPLEVTQAPALPEAAYAYAPGGHRAAAWTRQKPLMISEFGLMWEAVPKTVSVIAGDAPFAGLTELWEANALITKAQIEGFRAAGVTGVTPWNLVWYGNQPLPFHHVAFRYPRLESPGPKPKRVGLLAATLNPGWTDKLPSWRPNAIHAAIADAYAPQAVFDREWGTHAYAGSVLHRTLTAHNDTPRTAQFTLRWRWSGGGRTAAAEQHLEMSPLGLQAVDATLMLPDLKKPTKGTWDVALAGPNGRILSRAQRSLTVYPPLLPTPRRVAVVDPSGRTVRALSQIGIATEPFDGSATPYPIVVGEDTPLTTSLWNTLQSLPGSRIVILAQSPGWSGGPGLSVDQTPLTRTFVRSPHHPMLRGWPDKDLSWWQGPGETVVQGLIKKPESGAFLILADGGASLGGTSLVQWVSGSTTVWFCQYPVITRLTEEPMAGKLLQAMLRAADAPPRLRPLAYWGPRLDPVLLKAGINATAVSGLPTANAVLLIDLADAAVRAQTIEAARALRTWVRQGGRLWLRAASKIAADLIIRRLTGWGAEAVDVPSGLTQGALNLKRSALTDGISNADLDWTTPPGQPPLIQSAWRGIPESARLIGTVLVNWQEYAKPEQVKTASVLMSSGWPEAAAVWRRGLGAGDIIVDALEWASEGSVPAQLLARMAASFTQG